MLWSARLEARVIDHVEHVLARRADEDSLIELKAEWPTDPRRAARQIAALANAARGESVIWVIGVDERGRKLIDVDPVELANWWPQVVRWFADHQAPEMRNLVVRLQGHTIHVLEWETNRAPYVVNTGTKPAEREVPWREGNSTRSARRHELLRCLVPAVDTPTVEPIYAAMGLHLVGDEVKIRIQASVFMYATTPVTLPEYLWHYALRVGGQDLTFHAKTHGPSRTVPNTGAPRSLMGLGGPEIEPVGAIAYLPGSGLQVGGSDALVISGGGPVEGVTSTAALTRARKAELTFRWPVGMSDRVAMAKLSLSWVPKAMLREDYTPGSQRLGVFTTPTAKHRLNWVS